MNGEQRQQPPRGSSGRAKQTVIGFQITKGPSVYENAGPMQGIPKVVHQNRDGKRGSVSSTPWTTWTHRGCWPFNMSNRLSGPLDVSTDALPPPPPVSVGFFLGGANFIANVLSTKRISIFESASPTASYTVP